MMIKARNIHKVFGCLDVLKGVDVDIRSGEIVSIVGPSGAGKTTLLQILGTLDAFSGIKELKKCGIEPAGESFVEIDGVRVDGLADKELSAFRNKNIGFVFQFHQLLPEFTALENVCIPAMIGGSRMKDVQSSAVDLLEYLGLANRLSHKPSQLSGGEAQRVAIARALINHPKVIFADEPSGNLDSANAGELHRLILDLRERFGQTFVIVTHNDELARLADRRFTMRDGIVHCIEDFK